MRAIRQHRFGSPEVMQMEDLPDPEPGAGEVRIRVQAAGVHLLDDSIRAGTSFGMGSAPPLPMVPGREVAGVVDAVGPGVDAGWLGRPAVAHLGPTGSGGYAELTVSEAARTHPIPDGVDAATAVAAIGTGRTAAGILHLAEVARGETAIVTSAAGGLGVLFLQGLQHAGVRTIGLAGGEAKGQVARDHGADVTADYRDPDWPSALVDERATVVFDGVGGAAGRAAYDQLVPGGRLIRYGWASGEQNDYADPERPVHDVLGPAMMSLPGGIPGLEAEALTAAADGSRVPLVGTRFPLAQAAQAHRAFGERRTVGKVVLEPGR